MKRIGIFLLAAVLLAGCGTAPGVNTDVPNALYLGGRPVPNAPHGVRIVTDPAVGETVAVEGISCKNKLWDPSPSRDNAVALMLQQAARGGFDAVTNVKVVNVAGAVTMNCWAAISASGTAFHAPPPDAEAAATDG